MNIENTQKFPFKVEGESFYSFEEKLTAKQIIELAKEKNIPEANQPIESLILKGKEKTYSKDDLIDLSIENDFSLGLKVYKFRVNGQEFESNSEKLIALDIIKRAREKAVIGNNPEKLEDWLLETIEQENKIEFKPNEWVDLSQFQNFLLIPNQSTPVA